MMDQKGERKEHHLWLPPDYMSLAQLKERWLQKQREKEMREKQKEDEMREKQKVEEMREKQKVEEMREKLPEAKLNENQKLKRDWLEKGAHGRGGENNGGRERGRAIADKGKEKEIPVGGFGNKTHHKRKKKKKKNRYIKMEKYGKGNEVEKEKPEIETNNDVNGGGSKEVLSGVKGGNSAYFKDGLSRDYENQVAGYTSKRENGVRFNQGKDRAEVGFPTENKMVEKKGYSRNWRKTRRNRTNRLKETETDVSKGNVENDLENMSLHENLGVCSETGDLKGGKNKDNHVEYHGVKDEGINSDPKAEALVLAMKSLKIDEKSGGAGNGFNWRYGNHRRNNGRQFRGGSGSNDWYGKADDARRYGRFGRFEGHGKTKAREMNGMMWVRKDDRSRAVDNGRQFRGGSGSNDWYGKADDARRYGRFGRFEGHGKTKAREMNGMMLVRKDDRSRAVDGGP